MKQPRYVILAGCVVPRGLSGFLAPLLKETGSPLNSCYRGADAEPLLHKLGHQSQTELYDGWVHRRPGYLPANPPGYSTHELRSDGVAYPQFHRGAVLPDIFCGFDVPDGYTDRIIAAARKRGWEVWRPYPSGSEMHHLNFRRHPPLRHRIAAALRPRQTVRPGKQ